MGGVQPNPHRLRFVEKFMEDFQGSLDRLKRALDGFRRRVPVDGLVIQLQPFGEPFEWHAHIGGQLLRVNASAGLVVQFREDDLQSPGTAEQRLQLFAKRLNPAFQFPGSVQDFRSFFE